MRSVTADAHGTAGARGEGVGAVHEYAAGELSPYARTTAAVGQYVLQPSWQNGMRLDRWSAPNGQVFTIQVLAAAPSDATRIRAMNRKEEDCPFCASGAKHTEAFCKNGGPWAFGEDVEAALAPWLR